MKKLFLLGLLALFFSCKGGKTTSSKQIPADAFGAWMHSHEEDKDNVQVFRNMDYEYPPSRGREGFELKEDGQFIHTRIGATDRPTPVEGKWEAKGKNEIQVSFPGTEYPSFTVKILSATKDKMEIDGDARKN
ncbi:MAG: hypothetical protein H6581_29330 [Bacteroidia bacterium]|nr:hypothetical protein [Bacteroidia bacterium]